jgi:hypothetical protein
MLRNYFGKNDVEFFMMEICWRECLVESTA